MTPTPEPEESGVREIMLQTDDRLTEMGLEITVHSKAANLRLEIDLEQDPEYVLALLQVMPKIIEDKLEKYLGEEGD